MFTYFKFQVSRQLFLQTKKLTSANTSLNLEWENSWHQITSSLEKILATEKWTFRVKGMCLFPKCLQCQTYINSVYTLTYISLVYRLRNEYESNIQSNEHYLSSNENKAWKKSRPVQDLNLWLLQYWWGALPPVGAGCYVGLQFVIMNQHNDQLPLGLLAQLVEQCICIADVMGSNLIQAWIFFRPCFQYCLSSVRYCQDLFLTQ